MTDYKPLDYEAILKKVENFPWSTLNTTGRGGPLRALFMIFAILLPTTFERRYMTLSYLGGKLAGRQLRQLLAVRYHYMSRVRNYYRLLGRRITDKPFVLPFIQAKA